jgi:transposase-like protein
MIVINHKRKRIDAEYKKAVVEGFLSSLDTAKEHFIIKKYAYKIGLNSSTVTTWVNNYIENLQSTFKVELENSSLKKLNKKKVTLEKEINCFREKDQLQKEEINFLKNEKQFLKEENNLLKEELNNLKQLEQDYKDKSDALKALAIIINNFNK